MGRIISRHIFIYVAIATVVLTVVLVFGAWLTQSLRFIEIIIEKDITIGRYLAMVWLLLPNLTSIVLPICTLLATVYTLHRLISDNEVVIYKTVGLSNFRIALPLIVWGGLMMGVCGFLNNYLGPKANEQFYGMRNQISKEFSSGVLRDGAFNKLKDTIIYVADHTDSGQLEGIYIQDKGRGEDPGFTIFAQHGFLQQEAGHDILYLFNGNRQSIDSIKGTHTIAYFNEFKYDINIHKDAAEKVKVHMTQSFYQLLNPPDDVSPGTRIKMRVEAHKRILNPLFVFVFVLFSCVNLLSGQQPRRGRWKRIVSAIGICLVLEIVVLGLLNSLTKNHYAVLLSYGVLFAFAGGGALFLVKPEWLSFVRRRRTNVH